MAREQRLKQLGPMDGAPDWYGTPLGDLHFEWTPEEKLEIERYCEKTLKNIEEEGGMTPLERFKATFECKPRDRALIYVFHGNVFGARVLDSHADAIKPIDVFRNPKLWVKVNLANVARYKLDFANAYGITYGEELWGGHGRMIEYGNPVMEGDPPIKSIEDLEGLVAPDPEKDGLYPGYLWACRELRRIYDEYGLSKVLPILPRICGDPHSIVMMYMMGWAPFTINLRKNPEFCRRCLDLATEFEIKYGQAVLDACSPDAVYMCAMTGAQAPKGNEWLADYWARVGAPLAPQAPVVYGYGFGGATKWLPILWEKGALGPGSFSGGAHDSQNDYKQMIDFHREHNLWVTSLGSDKTLLDGPVSAIEGEIKQLCELGKSHHGFCLGIGMVDYWTPPEHVDVAVEAAKKYGRT
jgi:uroporphyrinogen-III decarboxylase